MEYTEKEIETRTIARKVYYILKEACENKKASKKAIKDFKAVNKIKKAYAVACGNRYSDKPGERPDQKTMKMNMDLYLVLSVELYKSITTDVNYAGVTA